MKHWIKPLTALIYGAGTALVLVLTILLLSHSQIILFPEVMLPMTLSDLAAGWLALGMIPMLLVCWAFCRCFHIQGKGKAVLVFLPGVVCGICAICIFGVLLVGMLSAVFCGISEL